MVYLVTSGLVGIKSGGDILGIAPLPFVRRQRVETVDG